MNQKDLLNLAAEYAWKDDSRNFHLGAIAVRKDGVIVRARNGSDTNRSPTIHAEFRVSRKLDVGACVYVARITPSGAWALAKPCAGCMLRLRVRRVRSVTYTIGPNECATLFL